MSKIIKWKQLQDITETSLNKIDPPAKQTVGSGSVKGNGDVKSTNFLAECKYRTRKNIIIDQKVWNKLQQEAELLNKIPILVSENATDEVIISLKLEDFTDFFLKERNS